MKSGERIPLHDHSDRNSGGRVDGGSIVAAVGGGSSGSGSVGPHATTHQDGGADEISIAGLDGVSTELAAHLADTSAAHAASAISFTPNGSIAATDVQAAIQEVRDEATGGATFGTPAIVLGTAAAAGSIAEAIRRDSTIVAFDATVPAALGTAATGSQAVAARRDHVHTLPKLDDLAAPDDNTDLDASTAKHGLLKKLTGETTKFLRADGAFATPAGSGIASYMSRRILGTIPDAAETLVINSTSYVSKVAMRFYHDWDAFPATHFLISAYGQSNEASQTVTFQLTPSASPTDPISAGGNDLVVTNTTGIFSSGWVAVSDSLAGIDAMQISVKGSTATVDFSGFWVDIAFKVDV